MSVSLSFFLQGTYLYELPILTLSHVPCVFRPLPPFVFSPLLPKGESRFLEKQRQTIEYLTRFKSFIVETDRKRTRALQKAEDERNETRLRDLELEEKKKKLIENKKLLRIKKKQLDHVKQYREFLERVRVPLFRPICSPVHTRRYTNPSPAVGKTEPKHTHVTHIRTHTHTYSTRL